MRMIGSGEATDVVGGKLRLKGKPLDVKVGGIKKKKHKKHLDRLSQGNGEDLLKAHGKVRSADMEAHWTT